MSISVSEVEAGWSAANFWRAIAVQMAAALGDATAQKDPLCGIDLDVAIDPHHTCGNPCGDEASCAACLVNPDTQEGRRAARTFVAAAKTVAVRTAKRPQAKSGRASKRPQAQTTRTAKSSR